MKIAVSNGVMIQSLRMGAAKRIDETPMMPTGLRMPHPAMDSGTRGGGSLQPGSWQGCHHSATCGKNGRHNLCSMDTTGFSSSEVHRGSPAARAQAAPHRQAAAVRHERDVSTEEGSHMTESAKPHFRDSPASFQVSRVRRIAAGPRDEGSG